jgi:hypothetical protein
LSVGPVVRPLGFFEHLPLVLGAHGGRLAVGADEIADAVGLLDHEPDFFRNHSVLVEFQLDEDIAGIELAVGIAADAVLHGADALGGNENAADRLEALDLDLARQRLAHAVFFVAGDSQDEKLHGAFPRSPSPL